MGNSLGGKKTTKVMKIDGETFKVRTPVRACEVLKDHPGLVLLDSEAVKHYGVRAKPLEAHKELQPKRLYFLVELPNTVVNPRRVHSGIQMSAKDRLESLVLSRRSASDLTIMKPVAQSSSSNMKMQGCGVVSQNDYGGGVSLKMRLPKAEVEKLIQSSKDGAEAAERIMSLCMAANDSKSQVEKSGFGERNMVLKQEMHWKGGRGRVGECKKIPEKRVSFMPISEGGSPIAVAS